MQGNSTYVSVLYRRSGTPSVCNLYVSEFRTRWHLARPPDQVGELGPELQADYHLGARCEEVRGARRGDSVGEFGLGLLNAARELLGRLTSPIHFNLRGDHTRGDHFYITNVYPRHK